ncbi:MAG: hypothetical protein DRJ03_19635 [Chloroflexi bacterium]|nr:MAG: hypothetical protein B6I35_15000 [Anaerolineaceae bacterium 4572_32.2]RLC72970.1 MAG: hypothetical protein DRI81_15690 [Chloroflexota bacterium]RLC81956.1 MAG: hypothetical protein DRJ03_19635 [Chloroflexota bacterium]HEY74189.1 hypothetical protein [Thermoflexia bacterium]
MKSKVLAILTALAVLSLVSGLIVGVALRDPEQGDEESSAGMIAIFAGSFAAITASSAAIANRRKSDAQHDEQDQA